MRVAPDIGLEPIVIYKWFWDVNAKIERHKQLAPTLIDSPITRSKDDYFSISGTDGKG